MGCVADAFEVATWFGDDIAFRADSYDVDLSGLPMLGFMLEHVGAGAPVVHRLRLASKLVVTRGQAVQRGLMSHCISTAVLAERIGLGANVQEPLKQMFGRWDGKGVPAGLGGEDLAFPIRLFHVADIGPGLSRIVARVHLVAALEPSLEARGLLGAMVHGAGGHSPAGSSRATGGNRMRASWAHSTGAERSTACRS